ncbi:hypothetical protein Scep_025822 [Stephania cephalantha]|uniref:Uncharacterized protein n=1 Tax=Stephania cephalantha TaxID=152367 RepID=A0AAP0EPJ7_9MAGN
MEIFRKFHASSHFEKGLNETHLVLIPKKNLSSSLSIGPSVCATHLIKCLQRFAMRFTSSPERAKIESGYRSKSRTFHNGDRSRQKRGDGPEPYLLILF